MGRLVLNWISLEQELESEKPKGDKEEPQLESIKSLKDVQARKQSVPEMLTEDIAATRIQTAFRAYKVYSLPCTLVSDRNLNLYL